MEYIKINDEKIEIKEEITSVRYKKELIGEKQALLSRISEIDILLNFFK